MDLLSISLSSSSFSISLLPHLLSISILFTWFPLNQIHLTTSILNNQPRTHLFSFQTLTTPSHSDSSQKNESNQLYQLKKHNSSSYPHFIPAALLFTPVHVLVLLKRIHSKNPPCSAIILYKCDSLPLFSSSHSFHSPVLLYLSFFHFKPIPAKPKCKYEIYPFLFLVLRLRILPLQISFFLHPSALSVPLLSEKNPISLLLPCFYRSPLSSILERKTHLLSILFPFLRTNQTNICNHNFVSSNHLARQVWSPWRV